MHNHDDVLKTPTRVGLFEGIITENFIHMMITTAHIDHSFTAITPQEHLCHTHRKVTTCV
mgnify:CR=1 FL=1